ncbi:SusC/RagA family TonB-linked outer membrane protein [Aestuariibaculum suncheonense]|uniref:TonB-dependent receptor n=1 Tax=Aestuariibaculum suncheonense TaxID=1028745 RepID=A0A8J6Q4A6_9FLAO|nr:TonB-dependent receptor [Aestuariibaculum suncheonense]MBD0834803.1 TonB-dependent receptor [Aestuariibaculum suncheonense]
MKQKLILLCVLLVGYLGISQNTVKGVVKDVQGMPLIGVNIVEKGTSNGVATDFDGNYSITLKSSNAILEFSYLGFQSQSIPVGNKSQLSVVLQEDLNSLNEVVVIGYGTQKRKDLTGSVVTVKTEDFTPGANSNAVELLKGTAAGVVVTQTNSAPGATPAIKIRGAGSINSSNAVLYVVDGIPGVSPNSLSPGDIESIEILKDASASSIYGTRAANGVVLVTTKKGKKGKPVFTYSTYTGMQEPAKLIDVLEAKDYMEFVNLRLSWANREPAYSASDIANTGPGTNWQEEITRRANVQNHQIGISGGADDGSTYYFGLNYFDQDGIVLGSDTKKYNLRSNITSKPIENLTVNFGINYTNQTTNSLNNPTADSGLFQSALRMSPAVPTGIDPNTGRYYIDSFNNVDTPLTQILGRSDVTVFRRFYSFLRSDYEIIDNLTATLNLAAEDNSSRRDRYTNTLTIGGLGAGGVANINAGESTHWLVETLLKYAKTFNEKHDFSVLGGATWEKFDSKAVGAGISGFLSDVLGTNALQSGDGELSDNVSSDRDVNQLNGFLGRLTYGYDDRYLLTASLRIDGSSRFARGNKYAYFPSASVGWRASNEAFLKSAEWINDLKFRVGYGELGNQGINNFETRTTLVPGGNSVFGDVIAQGVVPPRLANPNLTWETTSEINIGLDYGFANNRINGSVDYFNRVTKDQLFNKPLPSVVGFTTVRTNIGEVTNSGIDFALNTENFTGNFKWSTSLTFSYLKNEVTDLPDFQQEIFGGYAFNNAGNYWVVKEGAALRSYYGFFIDGLFQEGDDIANSPTPSEGFQPGMPRFRDVSGPDGVPDGKITADDRSVLGSPFPDYTFGIRNQFRYKNFTLDVFINGSQGAETFDAYIAETIYPQNLYGNTFSTFYFDRWTPENPNTNIPSGQNFSLYGGQQVVNSLNVVDVSYVRLKNVTLSYRLPLANNRLFSDLNIYVAADNLATWTDFLGYDPEASIFGDSLESKSYNSYPLARTFRLGIDVKF